MKLTRSVFLALLCTASGALLVGFALGQQWAAASLALIPGVFGWLGHQRGKDWLAGLSLVGFVGAAAGGILLGVSGFAMLAVVVAGLSAWDLSRFQHRLGMVQRDDMALTLEKRHLQRVGFASGLGFILGGAAFAIELRISFGAAVFVVLVAAASLTAVLSILRRRAFSGRSKCSSR